MLNYMYGHGVRKQLRRFSKFTNKLYIVQDERRFLQRNAAAQR